MRCYFYSFLIFFFWLQTTNAQTQINTDSLQGQSKSLIFTDPEKSLKISDYIIQNADNDLRKFIALLTKSENYFFQKNYISAAEQLKILNSLPTKNAYWELKKQLLLVEILDSLNLNVKSKELMHLIENSSQKIKDSKEKEAIAFQIRFLKSSAESDVSKLQKLEKEIEKTEFEDKIYLLKRIQAQIGANYLRNKKPDLALNYYHKINAEKPLPYFYFKSQLGISEALTIQKKTAESKQILQSLFHSESLIKNLFLQEIHQKTAQNYLIDNDLEKYSSANDFYLKSFDKEFENKQKARLRIIELLEFEKVKIQSNSINFYWKIVFAIGFILVVILIVFGFKLFKIKQKKNRLFLENKNKAWLESSKKEMEAKWMEEKNTSFIIPEKTEIVILEKLKKFEKGSQFLNAELSLNSLAKEFNTNTSYLSEIINKHIGKNFKTYINELRINYITDKMRKNPEYLTYKISYLADEAGFTSRTSFTTIFKSVTGVSPSVFIESIQQKNKE